MDETAGFGIGFAGMATSPAIGVAKTDGGTANAATTRIPRAAAPMTAAGQMPTAVAEWRRLARGANAGRGGGAGRLPHC